MLSMNDPKILSEGKGSVVIEAPGKTDYFIDMNTGNAPANAPFCYEKQEGDFVMRAKVKPAFAKTFDAGALFVYDTAKKWVKFAFELSDLGYPSAVSVVTDKVSDDCNGESLEGKEEVWLQLCRKGDNWALHYSENGKKWNMVRYFSLKMKPVVKVGFLAQSPTGKGCIVEFSGMKLTEYNLKDMRKGV
ncbi:MAG: DUF1349 domain-containing protein [Spirochaetaceae bacterium]|nr:DUF1349 domain-containing protein [Spirochaetaceae bacterium]